MRAVEKQSADVETNLGWPVHFSKLRLPQNSALELCPTPVLQNFAFHGHRSQEIDIGGNRQNASCDIPGDAGCGQEEIGGRRQD